MRPAPDSTAGNWSDCASGNLVIDTTVPVVDPVVANLVDAVAGGRVRRRPHGRAASRYATGVLIQTRGADHGVAARIARAEWFIDTDPGKGKGHALPAADGRFDSATERIRTVVSAKRWLAGTHTLYVRVRDLAGNWSRPTSAKITVRFRPLFADGFERGNLAAWSAASGSRRLRVTKGAALEGRFGLQAASAGAAAFVADRSPQKRDSYRASFVFDPNGSRTGGEGQVVFSGLGGGGGTLFALQHRTSGASREIRVVARTPRGFAAGEWLELADAPHAIDIAWFAAGDGELDLYVDGTTAAQLRNLRNGKLRLETVRLGPSANLDDSARGAMYLDSFTSSE